MNKTTLYLTRGSIMTALGFILVYLSTVLPTSKLSVLVLASFLIPASILMTNIKISFTVYISTSILSILFLGFRGTVIAYVFIFGLYGLIKLFIEKIRNLPIELVLKLVYFNAMLTLIYSIAKELIGILAVEKISNFLPFPLVILALNLLFFLYDFLITEFIKFFLQKIIPKIR